MGSFKAAKRWYTLTKGYLHVSTKDPVAVGELIEQLRDALPIVPKGTICRGHDQIDVRYDSTEPNAFSTSFSTATSPPSTWSYSTFPEATGPTCDGWTSSQMADLLTATFGTRTSTSLWLLDFDAPLTGPAPPSEDFSIRSSPQWPYLQESAVPLPFQAGHRQIKRTWGPGNVDYADNENIFTSSLDGFLTPWDVWMRRSTGLWAPVSALFALFFAVKSRKTIALAFILRRYFQQWSLA